MMGKIKFEVPHSLGRSEAKTRVEMLIDSWRQKHGVSGNWTEDTATFAGKVLGISIDARLDVKDDKIEGEASDPGFLFREPARKYLTQKFTAYLDSSKSLSSLKNLT